MTGTQIRGCLELNPILVPLVFMRQALALGHDLLDFQKPQDCQDGKPHNIVRGIQKRVEDALWTFYSRLSR